MRKFNHEAADFFLLAIFGAILIGLLIGLVVVAYRMSWAAGAFISVLIGGPILVGFLIPKKD